ncbi:MAG TPA: acyl-CoA dehydrogenase [Gammaproteobacteria bacterium]|nr:acyl-CoA dehydrogenase [Gammaproteobacteria bacterium]
MSIIIWVIALGALLAALARFDFPIKQWLLIVGAGLLALNITGQTHILWAIVSWSLFGLIAAMILLPDVRQKWFTLPLLKNIKAKLPPMSDTERTAIEAGSVWWESDLFGGNPDFNKLLNYPAPQLSAEEQAFIDGPADELCRRIDDWQITHELNRLPEDLWSFIKEQRFLGMIIPKEYGGLGFSALGHSSVITKIASRSTTTAVTVMVPNSLGPAELLLHYGTKAQKDLYLPRLADGREIPCFALTGPDAGSDAGAIPDTGIVCAGVHNGKEVLGLCLNWEKRYITLGPIATLLGLAFKVYDPDGLLGDEESLGVTCALIPTNTLGVEIGNRHYPLDSAFQNGPNYGHDVFIPMEWIIGGQEQIGEGWKMLMESLSAGRGISLPALSASGGKFASRMTGAYARVRKQFRLPIGKFEGVEEALARIGGYTYLMEASRTLTTTALDMGEKPSVVSAIIKYHMTELMRTAINDSMDVHGGRGICLGPANYIGRTYQSIPISITVEGANILTRTMIIFGQGAMRCHPYLIEEIEAVNHPDKDTSLKTFDAVLMKHLGFSVKNAARSFTFGWSNGRLAATAGSGDVTDPYFKQLSRMSSAFAITADLALLIMGGALKRREKLSGRFADALSHLYISSAILKHYHNQGQKKEDLPLLHWSMQYSLHQIQVALDGVIRNFPLKPLRWILRLIVFPTGQRYRVPDDRLGHRVASILLTPGETRDRLTEGVFQSTDPNDPVGAVEYALAKTLESEPIEKRLRKQGQARRYDEDYDVWVKQHVETGIIDNAEAEILIEAQRAIRQAIMVDDFEQDSVAAKIHQDKAA